MRIVAPLLFLILPLSAIAEVVYVKYRGPVDLAPFACHAIAASSLVHRICYDLKEKYLLVNLKGTYYHYCGIESATVAQWTGAPSKGQFYLSNVKGRYDCRVGRVPTYPTSAAPPAAPRSASSDRAVRNYQEVISGRKRLDQLTPLEQREVLMVQRSLSRRRGSGNVCDTAYASCTEDCRGVRTYFNYETGNFRSTLGTDFASNCESACSSGRDSCESEDDKDSKCDEFRSNCESDCPSSVFDYRAGTFRMLTDANSKCEDACDVGARACE